MGDEELNELLLQVLARLRLHGYSDGMSYATTVDGEVIDVMVGRARRDEDEWKARAERAEENASHFGRRFVVLCAHLGIDHTAEPEALRAAVPRSDGAPCGCVARVEALLREAEAYRSECDATAKAHFAKSERERDEDDEVTDQQVDARAAVQAYKNAVAALTATEERGATPSGGEGER